MKFNLLQTPEFLSLPIFGLDIAQSSIRVVKLKRSKHGLIPEQMKEVQVKEECSLFRTNGTATDCVEIKKTLSQLKKEYNMKFVHVSVPEEKTYIFTICVPQDALKTIDEFILYNLDQYVPLNPQEVVFDYKIMYAPRSDGQFEVVVTVIPLDVITQYTEIIESVGLTPVGFEPETHAIARAVVASGDTHVHMLINIDKHTTNISVVEEGFVQYTQSLSVTGEDLQKEKRDDALAILKDGINKVIIYWMTSRDVYAGDKKIEHIILSGDSIESNEIASFLESTLYVTVSLGNVWQNCFDLNTYIPKISKMDSLKYAVSIGLSLVKLK